MEGDGLNARKQDLDKLIGDAIDEGVEKEFVIHNKSQKQTNGSDCGPLTIENLIRIAASGNEITENIRQQHAQFFGAPAQAQERAKEAAKQVQKEQNKAITLEQVKEQVARNILKVAKVSDEQINHIMNAQDSAAKTAIMKRAEIALDEMGVRDVASFQKVKDKDLQSAIETQSKEFIAQIGRAGSWSIDSWDMRGKKGLHEKYTKKANKMKPADFDKNAIKALKYEKSKDERSWWKSFAYNSLYRKALQFLNLIKTEWSYF